MQEDTGWTDEIRRKQENLLRIMKERRRTQEIARRTSPDYKRIRRIAEGHGGRPERREERLTRVEERLAGVEGRLTRVELG